MYLSMAEIFKHFSVLKLDCKKSFQTSENISITYCVSFSPQTLNLLTIKITTVLPIQYKDQEALVNPILLDIKQEFDRLLKLCKLCKSLDCNEEIVPTSDCGEKLLFNMPVKTTSKDEPDIDECYAHVHFSANHHNFST
ncbi:hypothetical protein V8B97DRAFT_1917140 [Scleroderma yunnanense]